MQFKANVLSRIIQNFNTNYHCRKKLNYIGIATEYGRLLTLTEFNIVTKNDIEDCIVNLYEYGYDIDSDYQYKDNDVNIMAENIIERLQQIFSL